MGPDLETGGLDIERIVCGQNTEPDINALLIDTFRATENVELGRLTLPDLSPMLCPFLEQHR